MKKTIIIFIFVAAAAVILYFYKFQEKPLEVKLEPVKKGVISEIVSSVSSGVIKPLKRTKIMPETTGRIEKIYVKEGDSVKKGDLLLKIDDRELKLRIKLLQSQIDLVKIRTAQAKTKKDFSQKEFNRVNELFKSSSVPERAFDGADFQNRISLDDEKLMRAYYNQSLLSLDLARISLQKTEIHAPHDGIIYKKNIEEGEMISGFSLPSEYTAGESGMTSAGSGIEGLSGALAEGLSLQTGQSSFMEIVDDTSLYVEAEIDEVDISKVRTGQNVRISIDAFGKEDIEGKIIEISPEVSKKFSESRTVFVKTSIPEEFIKRLKVGMSADIEIVTSEKNDTLYVTTFAVMEKDRNKIVYTVQDGKLNERPVKIGISNWDFTEIIEGIREGEQIVIPSEVKKIKNGVPVIITEP
jgi:HlyD family secretion protein